MEENIVRREVVMVWYVKYVKFVIQIEKIKLLLKNNYKFFLANLKDWIQRNVKKNPESNIINFDKSAQNIFKKLPDIKLLNISNPPRAIRRPNNTTMCINNFFLEENIKANIENNRIKNPKNEGIKEVNDELDVTKLIVKPHKMRNIPYTIEIDSIFKPRNLYSFWIILLI